MVDLLSLLSASIFTYQLYEHPPVFTANEARQYCAHIPGAHVKNLFVRDKKKKAYLLVTVKEEKRIDLSVLEEKLKIGRLSFASNNDLTTMLGVQPGSVTPIAIINDKSKRIKPLFDDELLNDEYIAIHPLENTATISIKLQDLLLFIENYGLNKIEFLGIPQSNGEARCPT